MNMATTDDIHSGHWHHEHTQKTAKSILAAVLACIHSTKQVPSEQVPFKIWCTMDCSEVCTGTPRSSNSMGVESTTTSTRARWVHLLKNRENASR
jgi:hypothetical protein